jgi:glycosyltransferase involved in cell wall biosynthesis
MKSVSILIPVLDEAKNLPRLFRALRTQPAEIIFIDNGSTDESLSLMREFAAGRPGTKVLQESKRGFAEPLNHGLDEAHGDYLLFLDADALPGGNWLKQHCATLEHSDISVGKTKSAIRGKATAYGEASLLLFKNHSNRAAHAQGHALPWGPTCNLGIRRSLIGSVSRFSPEAGGAFDIDWCWRAILAGARLAYSPKAEVNHFRRNEREAVLRQFERYGLGEAWLQRTYSFLLAAEDREPDPFWAGIEAFQRIRGSVKAKKKTVAAALEEVAAAFSNAVRAGYERDHLRCAIQRRLPAAPVHWQSDRAEVTILVPGKGVTQFSGKMLQAWRAMQEGAGEQELADLFHRLFKIPKKFAAHEAHEFRKALSL